MKDSVNTEELTPSQRRVLARVWESVENGIVEIHSGISVSGIKRRIMFLMLDARFPETSIGYFVRDSAFVSIGTRGGIRVTRHRWKQPPERLTGREARACFEEMLERAPIGS